MTQNDSDRQKDYPPFKTWDPETCFGAVREIVGRVNAILREGLDKTKPLFEFREGRDSPAGVKEHYITEFGRETQMRGQVLYDQMMDSAWAEMAQTDKAQADWIFGKRSKSQNEIPAVR